MGVMNYARRRFSILAELPAATADIPGNALDELFQMIDKYRTRRRFQELLGFLHRMPRSRPLQVGGGPR